MATTRMMTTVLPHSVDPSDTFHVSLFFSHRLVGGGKLADYPAMVNWVKSLKAGTTTFTLHTDTLDPVRCTPLLDAASETAWEIAFPGDTAATDFPDRDVLQPDWKTFPANRTPDHAFDAHNTSAIASPVSRPAVATGPLAQELLTTFTDIEELRELIAALLDYRTRRDRDLLALADARDQAARNALTPTKPAPDPGTNGGGGGGPHLGAEAVITPLRSPIDVLLTSGDLDAAITNYLEDLNDQTANTPLKKMLRDVHAAAGYYNRPEEQPQDPDTIAPASPAAPAPPAKLDPDFHDRAAAACNVSALARALGLVVDVAVHQDDVAKLAQATRIWCDVTVAQTEKYVSPATLCTTSGNRFLAQPADTNRWTAGRLRLGDEDRYRVLDLDPDAGGLSLEQLLRSVLRAMAIEANGDGGSFAPASVRATGFAVAEIDRPTRLKDQLTAGPTGEPVVEQSGGMQPRPEFRFEGLLRGTRVEVWDDLTSQWHSLHERTVTASYGDKVIFSDRPDIGHLQNPPMSRVPGSTNTNPYYVHEVLAGWDGWSLAAARPGKVVIHNNADDPDPGGERIVDQPEATADAGLGVQSHAKHGSLPALRYGCNYSFRIAGVDLAGNSVPMDRTVISEPSDAEIQSATAYLDELRTKRTARDSKV